MNYIENNLALSRALEFASFIMPQAKYILEQGMGGSIPFTQVHKYATYIIYMDFTSPLRILISQSNFLYERLAVQSLAEKTFIEFWHCEFAVKSWFIR